MTINTEILNEDEENNDDELDMKVIREYESNLENGDYETFTHDEIKKMIGI